MNVYDVIREPLITEKGTKQEKVRKYFFRVDKHANKEEIREAVERLFNVKVKKVNTMLVGGKWKRVRFQPPSRVKPGCTVPNPVRQDMTYSCE